MDRRRCLVEKPMKCSSTWFLDCSHSQLKELCEACKLDVSGSKVTLANRLRDNPASCRFASNENLDYCIEMCRLYSLKDSDNAFDMILRILQYEHGTSGKASKLKPSAFAKKIKRAMLSSTQIQYQSDWGRKQHGPDVMAILHRFFRQADAYVATEPILAYMLFEAIFKSFTDNLHAIEHPEYINGMEYIVHSLHADFTLLKPALDSEQKISACDWLERFQSVCQSSNLLEHVDEDRNVQAIIRVLTRKDAVEKVNYSASQGAYFYALPPPVTPHDTPYYLPQERAARLESNPKSYPLRILEPPVASAYSEVIAAHRQWRALWDKAPRSFCPDQSR